MQCPVLPCNDPIYHQYPFIFDEPPKLLQSGCKQRRPLVIFTINDLSCPSTQIFLQCSKSLYHLDHSIFIAVQCKHPQTSSMTNGHNGQRVFPFRVPSQRRTPSTMERSDYPTSIWPEEDIKMYIAKFLWLKDSVVEDLMDCYKWRHTKVKYWKLWQEGCWISKISKWMQIVNQ